MLVLSWHGDGLERGALPLHQLLHHRASRVNRIVIRPNSKGIPTTIETNWRSIWICQYKPTPFPQLEERVWESIASGPYEAAGDSYSVPAQERKND